MLCPRFSTVAITLVLGVSVVAAQSEAHHHHDRMSRHLVINDLTDVVMIAEGPTTAGPFDEEEDDYIDSSDMLRPAGSNRSSVIDGVPLDISLQIFAIDAAVGTEFEGVQVRLWQTDAVGVYSAVGGGRQPEDTGGQKWLRNIQTADADGRVNFQTIMPGWYAGRCIHFHIHLRLPGETAFVATSQLFIADADLNTYRGRSPYVTNAQRFTPLNNDGIYLRLNDDIADRLTLDLIGSAEDGYSSSLSIGLAFDVGPTTDAPVGARTDAPTTAAQDTAAPSPTPFPIVRLTADTFKERRDENVWFDAVIDVRSMSEWRSGHIANATLVESLASFGTPGQVETPAALAGCEYCNLVVYCTSGGRAAAALLILRQAGFKGRLYNGLGVSQWVAAGYPLVTDMDSTVPPCIFDGAASEQCFISYNIATNSTKMTPAPSPGVRMESFNDTTTSNSSAPTATALSNATDVPMRNVDAPAVSAAQPIVPPKSPLDTSSNTARSEGSITSAAVHVFAPVAHWLVFVGLSTMFV